MASPIAWLEVVGAFPELGGVSVDYGEFIVTLVNARVDPANLDGEGGPTTRLARLFLAAHFGATTLRGIAAGPLTGESEGGLSRSYGVPRTDWSELQMTSYGQSYCALIGVSPARAGFVT